MKLRPYQHNCRIAIYDWFQKNEGNPLVVMATGTGKSVCIADLARDIQMAWPDQRIVVAVDVQELIAQNYKKFVQIWPDCSAGIYSAGLGKKQLSHKTLFVGIQSIWKSAFKIQRCDILIVDEAHMISVHNAGMWQTFIKELKVINPELKVIGFTATEYRMDSGLLHTGEGRMFDGICFRYDIGDAINDGYLCEVVPKNMATKIDLKGVRKSGGDFNAAQLQRAVNVDVITASAVTEILEYGKARKSGLIFSSGVEHAEAIAAEIRNHGEICEVITSETPDGERRAILSDFTAMRTKYVANNSVLTKGFDHPHLDLIACLRPTQSPVLWLQMLGRGTRPIYNRDVLTVDTREMRLESIAAGTKPNCLVLDFGGNTRRFGPIDKIKFADKGPSDGMGVPPMKDCPACQSLVFAGCMTCPAPVDEGAAGAVKNKYGQLICGHEFPAPELKFEAVADESAILSTQVEREEKRVMRVEYHRHSKPGKKESLRVDYYITQFNKISEWVCVGHDGYARERAVHWWTQRHELGLEPSTSVETCVSLAKALRVPSRIWIVPDGGFWRITNYDFAPAGDQPQQSEQAVQLLPQPGSIVLCDDEIPF